MGYPDICAINCKNFGTPYCPTSSKCMALKTKPHFKPKQCKTWFDRWKRRRYKKSVCKTMNYFCPDCIYHDHHFEGVIYRGTSCRLEGIK